MSLKPDHAPRRATTVPPPLPPPRHPRVVANENHAEPSAGDTMPITIEDLILDVE